MSSQKDAEQEHRQARDQRADQIDEEDEVERMLACRDAEPEEPFFFRVDGFDRGTDGADEVVLARGVRRQRGNMVFPPIDERSECGEARMGARKMSIRFWLVVPVKPVARPLSSPPPPKLPVTGRVSKNAYMDDIIDG